MVAKSPKSTVVLSVPAGFDLHPKKIGSGRRWASEKRTRGVDVGRLRPNHYNSLATPLLFSSLPLRKSYKIRLEEFRCRDPSCRYR
ncbi:hypothetical protein GW17_00034387 [Ensete ventricosum]|nr:hypothetical protein GW17_00034387 [Ensete ventricosum]RZS17838.1 hypothetical protein BHM03_00050030 [Ensete ventricosum]